MALVRTCAQWRSCPGRQQRSPSPQGVEESEGEEEWAAMADGTFDLVRNGGDITMVEVIGDDMSDDDSE